MHRLKAMKENLVSLVECALSNADQVDTKELGEAVDMIKDLEEAMYHCQKTKCLEEEAKEKKEEKEKWEKLSKEAPYRYYGGDRVMPYYLSDSYPYPERDIDRQIGRMYYSDGRSNNSGNSGSNNNSGRNSGSRNYYEREVPFDLRDSREGRSPMSRRNYMESKEMHKDKEHKVKELEKYMQELSQDIVEMIEDASPEEKQLLEKKMTNLASKVAQLNRNA